MGAGGQRHDPTALRIVQEAGWISGLVWTGAENLASTGIGSPDRPAHSEWIYGPRYAGPRHEVIIKQYLASCGSLPSEGI